MAKISWFDIKGKIKLSIRSFFYSKPIQIAVCYLILAYMNLVFFTAKRRYFNVKSLIKDEYQKRPLILAFWHSRIMMIPFLVRLIQKNSGKSDDFLTLSSKHGDGRFVGVTMNLFGFENIFGSTKSNKGKANNRGIDTSTLRYLIKSLKNGRNLGITPDGPRGPNQKINGQIIEMAKISSAAIIPISCSYSSFKQFKSWDLFQLPLPFTKINFYVGKAFEFDLEKESIEEANLRLEKEINKTLKESQKF